MSVSHPHRSIAPSMLGAGLPSDRNSQLQHSQSLPAETGNNMVYAGPDNR
jgi:hypothetical protein